MVEVERVRLRGFGSNILFRHAPHTTNCENYSNSCRPVVLSLYMKLSTSDCKLSTSKLCSIERNQFGIVCFENPFTYAYINMRTRSLASAKLNKELKKESTGLKGRRLSKNRCKTTSDPSMASQVFVDTLSSEPKHLALGPSMLLNSTWHMQKHWRCTSA